MQQRHFLVSQQQQHRPAASLWHRPLKRKSISTPHRTFALQNTPNQPETERDNVFVRLVVAAATETLRFLGVGSSSKPDVATATATAIPPGCSQRPSPGDIPAVLECLRSDYEERSYFITGVLSDGIYDEECYFADPTVSFTGRELWKRNLQLLVPFLEDPSIQLTGLKQLNIDDTIPEGDVRVGNGSVEEEESGKIVKLRADWILKCGLKLPWRPFINVVGSTEYDLAWPDNNRIVRHVESWDISAWEALILLFTPGKKQT